MEEKLLNSSDEQFVLSKTNFLYLKMLASRCGIDLDEYKHQAIYNRLVKRIRQLELEDFDGYCNQLRIDIEEELKFINLITNPTTSFFRENHHFNFLTKYLTEELANKEKLRIWSAGCSIGAEPYSIAMILNEQVPNIQNYDVKILATDINSDSLQTAANGIYDLDDISKMSPLRQKLWFERIVDKDSGENKVKVDDNLKKLITFNQLNLMDVWPVHGPFDIIFCRNVLIYFKKEITMRILSQFNELLSDNGVLILGHSENLYEERKKYVCVDRTTYRKIS